jgi:hypothetical protein|tara:strand:- start:59 stop:214 length:156 start_codon:yes stop_codon:yes gene_type:complete
VAADHQEHQADYGPELVRVWEQELDRGLKIQAKAQELAALAAMMAFLPKLV